MFLFFGDSATCQQRFMIGGDPSEPFGQALGTDVISGPTPRMVTVGFLLVLYLGSLSGMTVGLLIDRRREEYRHVWLHKVFRQNR
jgi:hypothetical protein